MSRVARSFVDALGTERTATPETVASFEALLREERRGFVPPTVLALAGAPVAVELTLPASSWSATARWELFCEDRSRASGSAALRDAAVVRVERRGETTYDTRRLLLDVAPPLGRHELTLAVAGYEAGSLHLVVVPPRAEPPPGRTWGIAVQLYTLRSARNLGIGDLADLRALCALAGERGASYVGINPLHASFRSDPEAASPYAPSSRLWLNWLAIAVDEVPEARDERVRAFFGDRALRAQIERLRAASHVDYTGVARVKDALLRACFAALDDARADAFAAWCEREGEPLFRFAVYETLVARYGRGLDGWPAVLRDPNAAEVARFAAAADADVRYAMYLQWCAAEQLAEVARDAARHGVRLYRDLAVGVDQNAADVWAGGETYVRGVTVGAPPDALNPYGQDWGLPPLDPGTLARNGYADLLTLLEANAGGAGALRIDHAFSLARLYWIPHGADARSGTYVSYPFDDLRGIVALASVRNRCAIVGEDLGTVPAGFREKMHESGILSYRILFFERGADGGFLRPDEYPALALAASGTHDLATIPAWLAGDDIDLRARLDLLHGSLEDERAARARDKRRFLDALTAHAGLAPEAHDDETAVVIAANRYLARTPCAITMAQLDDILGERAPVNVPGTSAQYPNWRRRLATSLESLENDLRFNDLCKALATERPRDNVQ